MNDNDKVPAPKFKTLGERAAYAALTMVLKEMGKEDEVASCWHTDKARYIRVVDVVCDTLARADSALIARAGTKANGNTLDDFIASFWIEMLTTARMYNND